MKRWDYNYLFPIRCYLDSEGHETDKKMRFVDMCIEVDGHIPHWNDKDSEGNWIVDKDREFNLIYSVCFMLACKMCTLQDGREYDDFAYFLAYDIFDKIERPRDINAPIKSILNYAKSIIHWRRMRFQSQNFQEVFDSRYGKSWDGDNFKNSIIASLKSTKKILTADEMRDLFEDFPSIIKSHVPKQLRSNKVIFRRIYISAALTIANLMTNNVSKKSSLFNQNNNIIVYGLPLSYKDIVKVVVNKSLLTLADEIKDTIGKFDISDNEYELLMNSAFDGINEADEY